MKPTEFKHFNWQTGMVVQFKIDNKLIAATVHPMLTSDQSLVVDCHLGVCFVDCSEIEEVFNFKIKEYVCIQS